MMPIVARLAELRKAAGIRQLQIAAGLRLGAVAGPTVVSSWESGVMIPNVGHICGYAELVGHRVVVQRDGETVGDLLAVFPGLAGLREAAGLTQRDVAECLYVDQSSVSSAERHAGPRTRLTTAVQQLGASGHVIELQPLEGVER